MHDQQCKSPRFLVRLLLFLANLYITIKVFVYL